MPELDEDLEGLIHISELSEQRVGHPKEVVNEGDEVTLRVIKIEPERHRIGLSLRKVDSPLTPTWTGRIPWLRWSKRRMNWKKRVKNR